MSPSMRMKRGIFLKSSIKLERLVGARPPNPRAIGRLVSLAFRSGIEPEDVVRQVKGISCHMPVWYQDGKVLSCSDAIAKAIEWHLNEKPETPSEAEAVGKIRRLCQRKGRRFARPILIFFERSLS